MDLLLVPIFILSIIIGALAYCWHLDHKEALHEMRIMLQEFAAERARINEAHDIERSGLLDRLMARDFQQFKENEPLPEAEDEKVEEETIVPLEDAREEIEDNG